MVEVRLGAAVNALTEILTEVLISLRDLRRLVREAAYTSGPSFNVLSPDVSSREGIGHLKSTPIDTVADEEDGLPNHLLDPTLNPEDCFGPVPPDAENPYVEQDPFVRDYAPTPTGAIKRG